jgi:uncharacterized DUF497 family protein
VKIEFDPLKSERNDILRGISFDCAHDFDWDSALIVEDVRRCIQSVVLLRQG